MSDIERQWYWDRRSNKAYYPVAVDEDTVRLITVWHREEFEGAAESGAMGSIDDLAGIREYETTMDLIDSFRLPEDVGDGDTTEEVADE
jgi:hypothetical protein